MLTSLEKELLSTLENALGLMSRRAWTRKEFEMLMGLMQQAVKKALRENVARDELLRRRGPR